MLQMKKQAQRDDACPRSHIWEGVHEVGFPLALSDPHTGAEAALEAGGPGGRSEVVRTLFQVWPSFGAISEALVSGLARNWANSGGWDSGKPRCNPFALGWWAYGVAVINGLLAG